VPTVHTPHIDRLAAQGVRLTHCFGAAPICCAARAAMLTGMYPQSNGQMDLCFPPFNWKLHEPRWHASHVWRERGYETHLFGLQHETHESELLGFDGRHSQAGGPTATQIATDIAQFLTDRPEQSQPFYLQAGFFETHSPFDWKECVADDSLGVFIPPQLRDSPTTRQVLASLQGAIRRVDDAIGVIEAALGASGLANDTLIVFTTDHGLELPLAKWHLYDAGIETAMILRWPHGGIGQVSGGVAGSQSCSHLTSHVDLLPTLLDLAGCSIPYQVQGRSFAPALLQPDGAVPHRSELFAMYQKSASRAVRTTSHKLIRHFAMATPAAVSSGYFARYNDDALDVNDHLRRRRIPDLYPTLELFDLATDPAEEHNIARDPAQAEVVAELEALLWQWMGSVDDPLLQGPERTPFYEQSIGAYQAWQRRVAPDKQGSEPTGVG